MYVSYRQFARKERSLLRSGSGKGPSLFNLHRERQRRWEERRRQKKGEENGKRDLQIRQLALNQSCLVLHVICSSQRIREHTPQHLFSPDPEEALIMAKKWLKRKIADLGLHLHKGNGKYEGEGYGWCCTNIMVLWRLKYCSQLYLYRLSIFSQ